MAALTHDADQLQGADLTRAVKKRELMGTSLDISSPKILKAHRKDRLGDHGVGIELYFEFIRGLAIVFLVLSILKVPQTIFTSTGTMLRIGDLYRSLLGNLGDRVEYDEHDAHLAAASIRHRSTHVGSATYLVKNLVIAFGFLDLVCTLTVFGFMVYFLRYRIPLVCDRNDRLRHTLADHTLMVSRLPPVLDRDHRHYKSLLKEHFQFLLRDWPCPSCDDRVKDIVLVRCNRSGIETLLELGRLQHELMLMSARQKQGVKIKPNSFEKTEARIYLLSERLMADEHPEGIRGLPVTAAFVSFQHASDKDFLVTTYSSSSHWFLEQTQAPSLRFHNSCLKVRTAPEPEDIIWEHLNYPTRKRVRNVLLIWIVVLAILTLSFFVSAVLERMGYVEPHRARPEAFGWRLKTKVVDSNYTIVICDVHLYGDFTCTEDLSLDAIRPIGTSMIHQEMDFGLGCEDPKSIFHSTQANMVGVETWFAKAAEIGCVRFKQGMVDNSSEAIIDNIRVASTIEACDELTDANSGSIYPLCTMARTGLTEKQNDWALITWNARTTRYCPDIVVDDWKVIGDVLVHNSDSLYDAEWYLSCYCLDDFHLQRIGLCTDFYTEYMWRNVTLWMMMLIITVINTGLQFLIQWLVWRIEHPWSSTQRMTLSFSKIFIAQYLNSGFNILLTSGHLFPKPVKLGHSEITGSYGDLSGGWYEEAGVRLMSFGYFHILFPQIFTTFFMPVFWRVYRKILKSRSKIQYDLDKLYEKPEFALDCKLASVTALACFVLTYSGPMPLMPVCGMAAMTVIYWCDKYDFIYQVRRPPKYTEKIVIVAASLLQVGLVVRTMISMSAFGHPLVSPSCSLGSQSDKLLSLIIQSAESEHIQLTYEYIPFNAAALAPRWAWGRFVAYTLNCASFFSTLYILVIAFVAINILGVALFYSCRLSKTGGIAKKIVDFFADMTEKDKDEGTYDDLICQLKERGSIYSYKMTANPAYRLVEQTRLHLREQKLKTPKSFHTPDENMTLLNNELSPRPIDTTTGRRYTGLVTPSGERRHEFSSGDELDLDASDEVLPLLDLDSMLKRHRRSSP